MCQIYIVLPLINEKEPEELEIFKWHRVEILQTLSTNHQNIFEIQMNSVVDSCFGQHQTVYYNDPELLFNNLNILNKYR